MISTVTLQNFRSYKHHIFEISNTTTVITGKNGAGKTNILEAVAVLCAGKSFKSLDEELILKGQTWCRIDGVIDGQTRNIKIKQEDHKIYKTYEFDNTLYKRLSEKIIFPTVVFDPNQLLLFYLGPEYRRGYLDDLLEATNPNYKKQKKDYLRVLSHRNALLKKAREVPGVDFFVWDVRLSELAGKIVSSRLSAVETINKLLPILYQHISQRNQQSAMVYKTNIDTENYESTLLRTLEVNRQKDIIRGYTSVGPHRDDLVGTINNQSIQIVGSRGESRSIVIALKLIETEMKEISTKRKPILLLDDVFGELDSTRRKALFTMLEKYQTIITATDADTIPLMSKHTLIKL